MQDDFPMLQAVKEHGIIPATQLIYEKWNTRWVAILWDNCWYSLWSLTSHPFWYHVVTFDFIVGCFARLLQSLIILNLFPKINLFKQFCWSIVCLGALLAATYQIGDTWFWVVTSSMYGWNLGFFILALSVLVQEEKNNIATGLLLCSGLYIGGAGEIFAVLLLLGGLLFLAIPRLRKKINTKKHLLLFLSMILLSFSIAVAGHGHSARSVLLPVTLIQQAIGSGIYFGIKIILFHSPLRLLISSIILIPFYFIGKIYQTENCISIKEYILKYKLPCLLIWSCWVMLHSILITKLMGDYGPQRAWSSISLMSVLMIGYLWWVAGKNNLIGEAKLLYRIVGIAVVVVLFGVSVTQFFQLKKYSVAFDDRTELLLSAKEKNDSALIRIPPLPPSGFLHDANIDATSQGAWLGLKNTIVVKNTEKN